MYITEMLKMRTKKTKPCPLRFGNWNSENFDIVLVIPSSVSEAKAYSCGSLALSSSTRWLLSTALHLLSTCVLKYFFLFTCLLHFVLVTRYCTTKHILIWYHISRYSAIILSVFNVNCGSCIHATWAKQIVLGGQ